MNPLPAPVISKPIYRVLTDLTQEPRLEVALPLAVRDLVRLKLKETAEQRAASEQRYGMDFEALKRAWAEGRIADQHSYEVKQHYWEWEVTVTDEARLLRMLESLL